MDKVLVVVAHPDDEVLLAGGTIAAHVNRGDDVHILILADGVSARTERLDQREFNARLQMASHASDVLGADGECLRLADQQLDKIGMLILTKHVEARIQKYQPNIVYTHWDGDLNNDHRLTAQAVQTACRPYPGQTVRELYMGEVPSSTEWAGGFRPNHFVNITDTFHTKVKAITCYETELRDMPHPRSYGGIHELAVIRGLQVGLNYAEAFKAVRVVV